MQINLGKGFFNLFVCLFVRSFYFCFNFFGNDGEVSKLITLLYMINVWEGVLKHLQPKFIPWYGIAHPYCTRFHAHLVRLVLSGRGLPERLIITLIHNCNFCFVWWWIWAIAALFVKRNDEVFGYGYIFLWGQILLFRHILLWKGD